MSVKGHERHFRAVPIMSLVPSIATEWRIFRNEASYRYDDATTRVIWHRLARCAGVPLIGSRTVGSTVTLKLAPSGLNGSYQGAPTSSQPCHQPCSPTTTRGSSSSFRRTRAEHAAKGSFY